MSLSATLFGRDSAIFKATNILGLGIPGWLDKKFGAKDLNIEGPRLSDLSVQTSTYGAPIPRLYGTIAVMGNLIWLENNRLKETVRKKKSSSGGKGGGGGSSEPTTTYSYSATFHLALCEGPIAGVRRMWCGDKLLYNAGSDDLETIIASNKAAKGWKLYLGTDSQMPDSRYEADVGAGTASAHRGLAYIAFYDFQLADYSNTLQGAQFKVEVLTSSDETYQYLLGGNEEAPTSNSGYIAGNPGGSFSDAFYCGIFDGPTSLWEMNKVGVLSPKQTINLSGYVNLQSGCMDNYSHFFYKTEGGNNSFIFVAGGDYEARSSVMRLDGPELFERNGILWIKFHDDLNATDPAAPNKAWVSRLDIGNMDAFYGDKVEVSSIPSYVAMPDGGFLSYNFSIESNVSGSCDVQIFDENANLVGGGSFPINSRFGAIDDILSAGYVDDNNNLIIACQLYTSPSIDPALRGLVFLIGVRLTDLSVFFQITKEDENNQDLFLHPSMARAEDGVIYVSGVSEGFLWRSAFSYMTSSGNNIQLSSLILSETANSSLLDSADVDVSVISNTVIGFRVSGGSIRSALEPLQASFPFDVRAHGYKIQFLPRGQASVATIPWDDLGATSGDTAEDIFQQSREMDTQLPAKTVVKYLDAGREYAINEQFSERLNTEAVNKVERELAIVLSADEAAGIAEMLNFLPWLERTPASFNLPPTYRCLEAGDVITVSSQTAAYEVRLNDVNETQDGRLECQGVPNHAALYMPAGSGSEGVPSSGTIGLAGESLFVPLDIPVIDETLQDAPGFVGVMAGYTSGWPGGIAVRSIDGGQTWADLQAYAGESTLGTARGTLPASSCTLIDQRTLTVDLISGELDSVSRDQMLAGINYAAYGVNGRWEIVRFQNASLQSDGSYLVSGFVRGEKGTEWATGLHAASDYFVLMDDPDNAFIGMAVGSIAVPATYRGVTSGASVDDANDVPFTYQGVNLECLSPVDARGARDGSGNFSSTFSRRSRLSSSWWAVGVVAPIGEASESYEVDVMNVSAVVRTITTSTTAFSYSAANQATDFGSAQSSITFRIYQLSATVGRGNPLEVTL